MNKEDLILKRLDRMENKLDLCMVDIAGLKVKAGVWGALAGLIPAVIAMGMWAISVAI